MEDTPAFCAGGYVDGTEVCVRGAAADASEAGYESEI